MSSLLTIPNNFDHFFRNRICCRSVIILPCKASSKRACSFGSKKFLILVQYRFSSGFNKEVCLVVENYVNYGLSWLRFSYLKHVQLSLSFILAHFFVARAAPNMSSSEVSFQLDCNSVIACMTNPVFMNEQEYSEYIICNSSSQGSHGV